MDKIQLGRSFDWNQCKCDREFRPDSGAIKAAHPHFTAAQIPGM